jgi:hypothetical protein
MRFPQRRVRTKDEHQPISGSILQSLLIQKTVAITSDVKNSDEMLPSLSG